MSLVTTDSKSAHKKLYEFLQRWTISHVTDMNLLDYSESGNQDTFTYWIEQNSKAIGEIGGGSTSSKFGIWSRLSEKEITSKTYLKDTKYKWFAKYGNNAESAFESIRSKILQVIYSSQAGDFHLIDDIELDSLFKWKIAFIYSKYNLLPIYKIEIIRTLAKHFEHPNYAKEKLSQLHTFILSHKEENEDFFDFSRKYFLIATSPIDRNYYIIGSKYDSNLDVFPDMLERSAISTGFLWNINLSHLVGSDHIIISKWIDGNISPKEEKFNSAKRTFKYFLNLRKGDLIAVKSQGRFDALTIIAYAEVKEVNGSVYQFGDDELGHLVHVDFLETGLNINTGLTYSQTIHRIIPGEREGHFEKIFGSYSITSDTGDHLEDQEYTEEDNIINELNDIRVKNTSTYVRTSTSSQIVTQIHNEIQNSFALFLERHFPEDLVKTERNRIDIWRKSASGFYIYEIKPYNTAYACIRSALGQLTDYAFSKSSSLTTFLIVVGTIRPNDTELKYIHFLKSNLGLNFSYEYYSQKEEIVERYP